MGQFKPMVKMMTTEPSIELKLAKGGAVKMKKGGSTTKAKKMADGGGALNAMMGTPALIGRPAVNAPVRAPGKPSMAARRKAMMAKPAITPSGPSMSMPAMKKGGKTEKHEDAAQDRAMIKKALAGKKFATGGSIPSEETYGSYKTTEVHQAKPDRSPAKTGDVKNGNAGGYKKGGKAKFATGGVAKANAGGYKRGGYATGGEIPEEESYGSYDTTLVHQASKRNPSVGTGGVRNGNAGGYKSGGKTSKKAYATGGIVDTGRPVAMPQGRKPVPAPVAIGRLAGTYKSGGRATPAEARLLKNNAAENAQAMRDAKTDSNLKYGSPKRFADGGSSTQDLSKGAYDKTGKYNRELEEALNPLSMAKELYGKAKEYLMPKGSDSVTKTKESVTVTPASKKRGGRAC